MPSAYLAAKPYLSVRVDQSVDRLLDESRADGSRQFRAQVFGVLNQQVETVVGKLGVQTDRMVLDWNGKDLITHLHFRTSQFVSGFSLRIFAAESCTRREYFARERSGDRWMRWSQEAWPVC